MNAIAELMLQNSLVAAPFAVLVAAGSRVWRRPAVTHFLWLLVLVKLLTPPLVTIPVGVFPAESPAPPASEALGEPVSLVIVPASELGDAPLSELASEQAPVLQEPERSALPRVPWLAWCLGISLAGTVVYFVLLGIRVRQFSALLGEARRAPRSVTAKAERLCRSIGLRWCPSVLSVPGSIPPTVWGLGRRTRIVLPAGLFARLDRSAQDTLLIHELAHVRRRDHWIRVVEVLVTGLYWWNPVVWLARRELREAEEQCCDRYVLRTFPGAARTYAGVLVDTVDFLSGARFAVPPAASAAGPTRCLRRRIEMVMRGTDLRSWSWMSRVGVAVAALLLLPLGATWAEDAEKAQEEPEVTVVEKVVTNDGGEKKVIVVTTGEDGSASAEAVGEAKGEGVATGTATVIISEDGKMKTRRIQVPAKVATGQAVTTAVAKAMMRDLKSTSRPKSLTITYADGSTEKIELGEYDSLTIDLKQGTVSMTEHKGGGLETVRQFVQMVPGTKVRNLTLQKLPNVVTSRRVARVVAPKKKEADIEDRLERLEKMLLQLQKEIKALKD